MRTPETGYRADDSRDDRYATIPSDLDRLDNLDDWEIADGEIDPRGWHMVGPNDETVGTIEHLLASPSMGKAYFVVIYGDGWAPQKRFAVPLANIEFNREEGKAYGPYTREQFRAAPEYRESERDYAGYMTYWSALPVGSVSESAVESGSDVREVRVPVTEETAQVRKEAREVGHVTLRKRVDVETKHISEPVTRTQVVAERRDVPAGEAYTADPNVTTLREGETLRVPIVEEELIVEKKPRVTGEVVLRKETETEQVERDVELRRERVEVEEEDDLETDSPRTPSRHSR